MAEQAWQIFTKAKQYLMDGTIDLDTDVFNLTLHTSAAALTTASLSTLTVIGSVGSEVTSTSGYSTGGTALASVTWATAPGSAAVQRFDCADIVVTALGSDIANIKYAVIAEGAGGVLLAYSRLSINQYTVTANNTHTITIAAGGIFELT